jgi:pimeloyl-ACP methyl ester carboxylesterase
MKKILGLAFVNFVRTLSLVSPVLTGKFLSLIWFRVSKRRPSFKREGWVKAASVTKVPFGSTEIDVFSRGAVDFPTVVLVHGWSGRWDQMIEIGNRLLDSNFHVIAFDFPSHGMNKGRESDLFEMSAALTRVSDYLNLNNPSIVCHSAGFLAVTHAYVARHFKFNCLVTINSPARMEYLIG